MGRLSSPPIKGVVGARGNEALLLLSILDVRGHAYEDLRLMAFKIRPAQGRVYIVVVCEPAKHSCLATADERLSGGRVGLRGRRVASVVPLPVLLK